MPAPQTNNAPPVRSSAAQPRKQVPAAWYIVAAVVVTAGLLVWAVVVRGGTGEGDDTAELAHVHGLGVNPADDTLVAGSHVGLFRVPAEGSPIRVSEAQDFMGFAVVGPDHFLASGHPGEGQSGPGAVGLIESTDGGKTWTALSLAGEADFHSLDEQDGRIYGLNAATGAFMVSEDKVTWRTPAGAPMADFAVSPDEVGVVLATTEQGLARSYDGGNSFQIVDGAPLMLLVDWAADGTVVGSTPEGEIHVSTDDGATWDGRGSLGAAPEALGAESRDEVYAAAGGAILASEDGGQMFTVRHQDR